MSMAGADLQTRLELETETVEAIESKAMILLREYRTIDADIALYESRAKGDGLLIQPSVTHALGEDEDDIDVLWALTHEEYTESEELVNRTLARYLTPELLRTRLHKGAQSILPANHDYYASCARIRLLLASVNPQSVDDKEILDGVSAMLDERLGDPEEMAAVHLTDTEQMAVRRWKEIERARSVLVKLRANRDAVRATLTLMEQWFPMEEKVLRLRYIEERTMDETMDELGIDRHPYEDLRRKAMNRFISRTPVMTLQTGLLDKSPYRKRGPRIRG